MPVKSVFPNITLVSMRPKHYVSLEERETGRKRWREGGRGGRGEERR